MSKNLYRDIRKKLGLTQSEIAELMCESRQRIHAAENASGERVAAALLLKYFDASGMSAKAFLDLLREYYS